MIRRRGPWRTLEADEFATLEWGNWFNHRRLLEPIGNIPPAEAEASDTTETAPTQHDRHIRMIKERGRLGWQRAVDYGRRSLGEVASLRCTTLIGRSLHARTLPRQKTEAKVACKVINIMTGLGMPVSRRAT